MAQRQPPSLVGRLIAVGGLVATVAAAATIAGVGLGVGSDGGPRVLPAATANA